MLIKKMFYISWQDYQKSINSVCLLKVSSKWLEGEILIFDKIVNR